MNSTKKSQELLQEWKIRLNKAQIGHYISSERYARWHNWLGIPLVILTTIVGTSSVVEIWLGNQQNLSLMLAVFSFLSALLASLQTFIRPGEKAENHRSKAARYGTLRRDIERFLISDHDDVEFGNFLNKLQMQWDNIAYDSPVTPRSIRKKITKLISVEKKEDAQLMN